MVEDNGTIADDTSSGTDPDAEAPQAPRRRSRRAASRPAGPPVVVAEPADVPLGADQPAADVEPAEEPAEDAQPEGGQQAQDEQAQDEQAVDEQAQDEQAVDEQAQDEQQSEGSEVSAQTEGDAASAAAEVDAPAPETAPRRSRRATRGVTTVAFSAPELPQAAGTATVPFEAPASALFQPPDETKAVRRRGRSRTAAAEAAVEPQDAVEESADEAPGQSDKGPRTGSERTGAERTGAERTGAQQRRGAARQRPLDEDEGAQDESDDQADEGNDDLDDTDEDGDAEASPSPWWSPSAPSGSGRRGPGLGRGRLRRGRGWVRITGGRGVRRGRRRAGARRGFRWRVQRLPPASPSPSPRRRGRGDGGPVLRGADQHGGQGPGGRDGRPTRCTSVRGSTRLEAKSQRRRDGREAGRPRPRS